MNYDTLIYGICEKLLSTYEFYSAKYELDDEGFLMCARIYSKTNLFSAHFMETLLLQKGSILVGFGCDDSDRPVITIYNDVKP